LRWVNWLQKIVAARQRASENIVRIRRNHQPVYRKSHAFGHPAGENIAEIAGRHDKGDFAVRSAKGGRAGKIIHRLEKDAREIDRIHPAKIKLVAQLPMIEHILDASLRVVERAFKRDGVNVAGLGRRHLAALHLRYAPMRIKDEDIDLGQTAKGLDGGGPRIARGCANEGRPLAPRVENMVDELG